MIDTNELRNDAKTAHYGHLPLEVSGSEVLELLDRLETAEKERDVLNAKVERMEQRLRLILEEPENTMSNSKAMREMLKQARLALEGSK